MRPAIIHILKQLLENEITVYTTALRVKGKLFLINTELRVIGLELENQETSMFIDIKAINAIDSPLLKECEME